MERNTRQREAVLSAIVTSGEALTPPAICERAKTEVASLNLSTVYRQLKGLEETGEILRVELPGQPARFEARCTLKVAAVDHHHHHFHCNACDRVFAIHKCPGPMKNLVPRGFRVEHHDLTLHGRCSDCSAGASAR